MTRPAASSDEAIESIRAACERAPNNARLLVNLARALLADSRAVEAVAPAERAFALAPGLPAAARLREAVHAAVLAGDPELVRLELTSALEPANAEAHLVLGQAYASLDRPQDAERQYKSALALGQVRDAHAVLASLYLTMRMLEAAEHHARAVLAAAPQGADDELLTAMAHQTLAGVLEARGDHAAAADRLDQAYATRSYFRQRIAGGAYATLVLVTCKAGNIPYKTLLPPMQSDCVVWYMEHARRDQFGDLPDHAVVLNAIGDADLAMASAEIVDAFITQSARPVLNRPARVRATFRHRLAETLTGIDGVIVPKTARLDAPAIAASGLAAAVAGAGLETPVLVRPVASHGGAGLVLAADAEALAQVDLPAGSDAYVTCFHDCRSADGYHRKYRMIFVDRRAYPYHLAISPHWMTHHQTSEMAGDPARMREELDFLSDPAAAIGPRALAAVEAIGQRLDLDYAGVDFTVTAEGEVLVFEANATMLTHLEPEDGPFAAKNAFVRTIIEAFQSHLTARATGGD